MKISIIIVGVIVEALAYYGAKKDQEKFNKSFRLKRSGSSSRRLARIIF